MNTVDLGSIKGERIIAVNNAYGDPILSESGKLIKYKAREWVDCVWFGDRIWYDGLGPKYQGDVEAEWMRFGHKQWLKDFRGLKVHCIGTTASRPGTHRLLRGKPRGIEERPTHVAWNENSGASAVNLAYHFGAKRIVLLGFDMAGKGTSRNWHGDHHNYGRGERYEPPYKQWEECWKIIRMDAHKLGLEIINANPESKLEIFPKVRLGDLL